ncbi:MAG: nucleotidyltransferase domain-containing protein [Gammaproteobacteria bacterium]|nr:nucleotidyltransferase domain-containing protein [Gammaproteobacteria bacterium]
MISPVVITRGTGDYSHNWYMGDFSLQQFLISRRDDIIGAAEESGFYNVRLFGSVARGDYSDDSDIDLLVDYHASTSIFDLGHLIGRCEEILNRRVDVVTLGCIPEEDHESVLRESVPL